MQKIGSDIGGTFTDLVLTDDGTSLTLKVPSTPDDPSAAAIRALRQVREQYGVDVRTSTMIHRSPHNRLGRSASGLTKEWNDHALPTVSACQP